MKLTLEHYEDKVSKETKFDDLTTVQVLEDLVIPVLVAAGFTEDAIIDSMGDIAGCAEEEVCQCCGADSDKCQCCDVCGGAPWECECKS